MSCPYKISWFPLFLLQCRALLETSELTKYSVVSGGRRLWEPVPALAWEMQSWQYLEISCFICTLPFSILLYFFSLFWHLDYVNLVLAPWGWLTQDGWCWWPGTAAHMPRACRGEACLLSEGTLSSKHYLPNWLENLVPLILYDELSLARKQMDYQESFAEW